MEEVKDLKTFAKEAKIRFKHGFWKNYNENKQKKIEEGIERGFSEKDIIKIQTEKAKREIKTQFDKKNLDDIMYEKAVSIFESDEIILNPIKRMIDDEVYSSLNDTEKQRYILDLTAKFNEFKERYEKEKLLS